MTIALGVIAAHLLAGIAHGYAHDGASVALTTGQTAFVWLVATVGPITAGIVVWRGRVRVGGALLIVTMLASTVFDGYYHAVARTPDHVHAVDGSFATLFVATAALVSVTDLLGVVVGAWLFRRGRFRRDDTAPARSARSPDREGH